MTRVDGSGVSGIGEVAAGSCVGTRDPICRYGVWGGMRGCHVTGLGVCRGGMHIV